MSNGLCKDPAKMYKQVKFKDSNMKDQRKMYRDKSDMFTKDRTLKRFGWSNDLNIFNKWLNEATGKDFGYDYLNKKDWKKFDLLFKSKIDSLNKGWGEGFNDWKVMGAILRKLPYGDKLSGKINAILAYQRKNHIESGREVATIVSSIKKMAGPLGIDTNDLRGYESAYMDAVRNRKGSSGQERHSWAKKEQQALSELRNYLGDISRGGKNEIAGEFYKAIRDVMNGANPERLNFYLNGEQKQWNRATQIELKKIQKSWRTIRTQGLRSLINGLNLEIRSIKRMEDRIGNNRRVTNAIEELKSQILQAEILGEVSGTNRKYDLDGRDKALYGLDKDRRYTLNMEYSPRYLLGMVKSLSKVESLVSEGNNASAEQIVKGELTKLHTQIGEAKQRMIGNKESESIDPLFKMQKYIHDVSFYNYKANMKDALIDVVNILQRTSNNSKYLHIKDKEAIDMFVDQAYKTLEHVMQNTFLSSGEVDTMASNMSRLLTSFQFGRTMGGSFKSALKNYTQRFFEFVELGFGARGDAKQYLSSKDMEAEIASELRRHGLYWSNKSVLDKLSSEYTKIHGTKGSISDKLTFEGLGKIGTDKDGNAIYDIRDESLLYKSIRKLESGVGKLSIFHTIVEDANRVGAFKAAFARIHQNLSNKPDAWLMKEFGVKSMTDSQRKNLIKKHAGDLAYGLVTKLHFDYSSVNKAKVLTSDLGKVVGQFQHYRFSLIDLQSQWIKAGLRDIRTKDFGGEDAMKLYRLGMVYTMSNLLTFGTGLGFYNLLENDSFEFINRHKKLLLADTSTEEGKKEAENALYGMGLLSNLGPSAQFFIEAGRLLNFYDLNKTSLMPIVTASEEEPEDLDGWQRSYELARLINIQASRSIFHSIPAWWKGNTFKAIKTEMGLHMSYDDFKAREEMMDWVSGKIGVSRRAKKSKKKTPTNELIMKELHKLKTGAY